MESELETTRRTGITPTARGLCIIVEHLREAALQYCDEGQADALARNVATALLFGADVESIGHAVEHRRQYRWIEVSDERAARLVAALERAWSQGTREVEGR